MRVIVLAAGLLAAAGIGQAQVRQRPRAAAAKPSSAAPSTIPADGVLGEKDLVAIARASAKLEGDKFSEDPTVAYVGREYSLLLPKNALRVDYSRDSGTLTASTPSFDDGIDLVKNETEKVVPGQNSFGARVVMTQRRGSYFGILLPGPSYARKPQQFSAPLAGAEARALSGALRLRVSGVIKTAEGGSSPVLRTSLLADATIDDPVDVWIKRYLVAVTFAKAEWIDSRTGAVISTTSAAE